MAGTLYGHCEIQVRNFPYDNQERMNLKVLKQSLYPKRSFNPRLGSLANYVEVVKSCERPALCGLERIRARIFFSKKCLTMVSPVYII